MSLSSMQKSSPYWTKEANKEYIRHTGFPGGIKRVPVFRMREEHPERLLEKAISGMLPKTVYDDTLWKNYTYTLVPSILMPDKTSTSNTPLRPWAKRPISRNLFYASGKRKTSVARVRLYKGTGRLVVNGKEAKTTLAPLKWWMQHCPSCSYKDRKTIWYFCKSRRWRSKQSSWSGTSWNFSWSCDCNSEMRATLKPEGYLHPRQPVFENVRSQVSTVLVVPEQFSNVNLIINLKEISSRRGLFFIIQNKFIF